MSPNITLTKTSLATLDLNRALDQIRKAEVLVGITQATSSNRYAVAKEKLDSITGKGKKSTAKRRRLTGLMIASGKINNAELLYIQTNGSPIRHIPKRPVIEPAIQADGNRQEISAELAEASAAYMRRDPQKALVYLQRAGIAGQNASKRWFVDPRNGWAPNKPSTIRSKGSARPLIDTGAMRKAITFVVRAAS